MLRDPGLSALELSSLYVSSCWPSEVAVLGSGQEPGPAGPVSQLELVYSHFHPESSHPGGTNTLEGSGPRLTAQVEGNWGEICEASLVLAHGQGSAGF